MKGFLEYVPGESFLHTMNPVAKLVAAFLLVIACFATSNFILLAVVIALDAVMNWKDERPGEVIFCCFSAEQTELYRELLSRTDKLP